MTAAALTADFFDRSVTQVAIDLLGQVAVRRSRDGVTAGRIVETEAYLAQGDSAAHSAVGINRKNATMFGPAACAYVYTIHARQCFNVVTRPRSAVLIRALEPLRGADLMAARRGTNVHRDLCRGPGRLTEALMIGREFDGWSLVAGRRLWIESGSLTLAEACERRISRRIGVTSAHDLLLRFHLGDSPFVSGTKRLNTEQSQSLSDWQRRKNGDFA